MPDLTVLKHKLTLSVLVNTEVKQRSATSLVGKVQDLLIVKNNERLLFLPSMFELNFFKKQTGVSNSNLSFSKTLALHRQQML